MKKIFWLILSIILHICAIGIIIISFFPLAKWYFDAKPLWGVDFYYTATLVNFIKSFPVLPQMGWNSIWFSGWPLLITYPILHYYFLLPLTYIFDLIPAIKYGMLISTSLFFIGNYLCFYTVSKSRILSLVLTVAGIYSVGVYGAMMWGGSLPNHATIAFYPWVILFIILYLKFSQRKYLLLASLLTGLSILAHPQITIAYIFPTVFILLGFSFGTIKFIQRIKSSIVFSIVSIIIGLPMLILTFTSLGDFLRSMVVVDAYKTASSTTQVNAKISQDVIAFHKNQPWRIINDSHPVLFIVLGIAAIFFILGLIFKKRILRFFYVLPFFSVALYYLFYIIIYGFGISFYHGGWYRLFWSVPFWVGLLASGFWGSFYTGIKIQIPKLSKIILIVFEFIIFIGGGYFLVTYTDIEKIKHEIVLKSIPSSAYPDIVNMQVDSDSDRENLSKKLVPGWLNANRQDYRLYSSDQTVNIWWNSIFKMPLSRGYFDPLKHDLFFWLDASLSQDLGTGEDQLVSSFKYPKSAALNNTLFLVNWYGVKYFEAGHASPTVYAPLPKSFSNSLYMEHEEELDFNSEKYSQANQKLHYYGLKDEYITPILMGSNSHTLCIVATDSGFDTTVRALADANLGINKLIPLKLGNNLDKISPNDLGICDSLIVYDYKYQNRNKSFSMLETYVKKGKKIFIDTGVEVAEANGQNLPEIFPMNGLVRKPLGKSWNLQVTNTKITNNIDVNQFDPPLFDKTEWNFSYPVDNNSLRQGTEVVLKNYDYPILTTQKIGSGLVIWSGMNLPYHVIRSHNLVEVSFFKNIVEELLGKDINIDQAIYQSNFISPQKREITTQSQGVIFKEMLYQGWTAQIKVNGRKLKAKIYPVGPADPGFMYISIPQEYANQKVTVTFIYYGSSINWITSSLSFMICLIILEKVIFNGKLWGFRIVKVKLKFDKHIKSWWEKEDENN